MRNCLNQAARGAVRKLRVAVQRDDKSHVGELIRAADLYQALGIVVSRAINQSVELFQLPTLALPTDEFLLGLGPFPLPMEEEEPLTAITAVEVFH